MIARRFILSSILWFTGICATVVVLVFVHPWLLTLPGRIGEMTFESGLHQGMSRAQAGRWKTFTGGYDQGKLDSAGAVEDSYSPDYMLVWYEDWGTFCLAKGRLYVLHFDKSDRLESWGDETWVDGC